METERVTGFPLTNLDRRPRKRARLGWDVLPEPPKGLIFISSAVRAQLGLFCGQDVGNVTSYASSRQLTDLTSAPFTIKGVAQNGSPPRREDDKDGHFVFELGENLTSRCNHLYHHQKILLMFWCLGYYADHLITSVTHNNKINSKMGEGTFGQVLECWDRERKEMVAIKIVRGMKKYRDAAMIEVEMLQQLGKHDNGNRCVQIWNWFDYRNHICIVFEKLGPSLYDFLRKNNYRSFPIDLVREIGRQLLDCVAYRLCAEYKLYLMIRTCHHAYFPVTFPTLYHLVIDYDLAYLVVMHDLRLIHTDLKPENILLTSPEYVKVPDYKVSSRSPKDGSYYKRIPKSSAIKVIDFGSTTYDRQNQTYVVSTRHYRAPEVILGLGWTYPCDIWSVGCILVELCSGEALFQTHENLEHLAMMEKVLGPLPQHMLKRVDRQAEKYVRRGRLDWPEGATSRDSIKAVLKLARLQNIIMQHVDHSAGDLINLLQGLLRYDPSERLTAREALRHPFFTRDHLRR
ncbi:hypothetical protein H5410_017872 [Solanum commersonii]|uniref:dual-specificity kinase n=2 Tax=Solanum TaxID=4107 RepID=A0A9J6A0Q0_SOLCO|nr:hypothetical protein H5410_017872 [Solanum commersonii]